MHLSVDESTDLSREIIDLVKGPQKTVSRMITCTFTTTKTAFDDG